MVTLLLVSLLSNAHAIVQRVYSEACGCSIEALDGLRDMPRAGEDAAIHLGVHGRIMYVTVEVYPATDFGVRTLAGVLDETASSERTRAITGVRYGTLGDHPAAWMDVRQKGDDVRIRKRVAVVDATDRFLILQGWSLPGEWYDVGDRIERVFQSLQIDPPTGERSLAEWPVEVHDLPLLEARRDYVTPTRDLPWSDRLDRIDADGWTRTTYPGPLGDMAAYHHDGDVDGPLVVWIPRGVYAPSDKVAEPYGDDNHQSAHAFAKRGLDVFVPTFRGMADNPGQAEFFLGETEDLLAAIAHARTLPGVDPDRIYVVGAGDGGTHALLAAAAGVEVRTVVSINGWAWQFPVMARGGYAMQPFAVDDADASGYRSAIHWAPYLASPVRYLSYEGAYDQDARMMARFAVEHGRDMTVIGVPFADEVAALPVLQDLLAARILGDEPVAFTEADLHRAMRRAWPKETRLGR